MKQSAATEAEFQDFITTTASVFGWRWWHNSDSRRTQAGWPDLNLLRNGDALFLEVKAEKGRVSKPQQETIDLMRSAGLSAHIVRPSDTDWVISRLRGKR